MLPPLKETRSQVHVEHVQHRAAAQLKVATLAAAAFAAAPRQVVVALAQQRQPAQHGIAVNPVSERPHLAERKRQA